MSDAHTPPTTEKKFCLACAGNKKEGLITPDITGRCPVCSSDSLLSIDALTKFLGSKTNEQNLSVQEENALISDFSSNTLGFKSTKTPARETFFLLTHNGFESIVSLVEAKTSSEAVAFASNPNNNTPWYPILTPKDVSVRVITREEWVAWVRNEEFKGGEKKKE